MPTNTTQKTEKKDYRQMLLSLIEKKYGIRNAMIMDNAFKKEDKQISNAMLEQGATAEQVGKTRGIDLSQQLDTSGFGGGGTLNLPNIQQPQTNQINQNTPQFQQSQEQQRSFLNKLLIALGSGLASAGGRPEGVNLIAQLINSQGSLETQMEERRIEQEKRRLRQEKVSNIRALGGTVDYTEMPVLEEESGLDADSLLSSGRAERRKDGRGLNILSDKQYERLIEEGKFTPEEQKNIRTIAEEINAWSRVARRMDELGVTSDYFIDPKTGKSKINATFEKTNNPWLRELGVFSIPARFEIARQFQDDPKLAAVARDVELAFQKFRTRVTGAQASDKEIQRLRNVIAKLTDQPEVFFQTIFNFMENSREDFDIQLQAKESFGRDVSQFRGLIEELPSVKKESGIPTKIGKQNNSYQSELDAINKRLLELGGG